MSAADEAVILELAGDDSLACTGDSCEIGEPAGRTGEAGPDPAPSGGPEGAPAP